MPTEVRSLVKQFTGAEANRAFFTPLFVDEDLKQSFTVMPNVRSKKKMYFFNRLEKILKAATGCGFRNTGSTSAYERYVETFPMQAGVEQCYDELADTAMMELINTGNMITELQGTELASIIESLVLDALKLDVQRVCWFGDRSLADANYNQMDGVWKKLLNSPAEMPKVTVATGALATGDAIDILNTMYKAQTKELRGMPNNSKAFYVTTDLYEAYQEDLENARRRRCRQTGFNRWQSYASLSRHSCNRAGTLERHFRRRFRSSRHKPRATYYTA